MISNILLSRIAYLHVEKLLLYIILKKIGETKPIHRLVYSFTLPKCMMILSGWLAFKHGCVYETSVV